MDKKIKNIESGFSPIYILIILAVILVIVGMVLVFSGGFTDSNPGKVTESKKQPKIKVSQSQEEKATEAKPLDESVEQVFLESTDASPDYDKLDNNPLTRSVPSGWRYAVSTDGIFELAYDPQIYIHESSAGKILLKSNETGLFFSVSVLPYDGGSRHSFIYKAYQIPNLNDIKTKTTYEQNYTYNNRSGLVIYNVYLSATSTIGMIDIDGKRAFLLGSDTEEEMTRKIISTLKILK